MDRSCQTKWSDAKCKGDRSGSMFSTPSVLSSSYVHEVESFLIRSWTFLELTFQVLKINLVRSPSGTYLLRSHLLEQCHLLVRQLLPQWSSFMFHEEVFYFSCPTRRILQCLYVPFRRILYITLIPLRERIPFLEVLITSALPSYIFTLGELTPFLEAFILYMSSRS